MTAPPALLVTRSVSSSDVSGGNLPEVAWEHDASSGAGDGVDFGDGYYRKDCHSNFRTCVDGMSFSRASTLPAPALVTAQADFTPHPGAARQQEYQGGGGGGGNGDLFYDCDDAWMRTDTTWMHLDDHSAALSQFLDGLPSVPVDASGSHNAPFQAAPGSTDLVTNAAAAAAETGAYILVESADAAGEQRCGATEGGCDWLEDILPSPTQPCQPEVAVNQVHAPGLALTSNNSMDWIQGVTDPPPASAPPLVPEAKGPHPVDVDVMATAAATADDDAYAVPNPSRGVWWTPQSAAPASGALVGGADEVARAGEGGGAATRKRQREPSSVQQPHQQPHQQPQQLQQQRELPISGEADRATTALSPRARGSRSSSSSGGGGGLSSSSGGSASTSRSSRADGALVSALRRCLNAHAAGARGGSARKGAEELVRNKKAEGAGEVATEVRCGGAAAGTGPAAASGGHTRTAMEPPGNADGRDAGTRVVRAEAAATLASAELSGTHRVALPGAHQRNVLSQSQPRSEAPPHSPPQPELQALPQAQPLHERQLLQSAPILLPPAPHPALAAAAAPPAPIRRPPAAPSRVSPPPAATTVATLPAAHHAAAVGVAPPHTTAPSAMCLTPMPAASSVPGGPAGAASTAGGGTEGEGVGEAEGEEGSWEDEEQERRRKRLMRNRQSALQSRQRRKSYVSELEGRCAALQATIGQLRQVVAVTAYENGALRDELARLHQVWAAGASTAGAMGAMGVAGVAGVAGAVGSVGGAAGGASSEDKRGEEEVEEGKQGGGSVSGGGVRADAAEPAVLESDSLPSESLLRPHRHLSPTTALLLTLFFQWALFLWVLLPPQQPQHLPPWACSAGLSLAYLSLHWLAHSPLHHPPQHAPCKRRVQQRQWQWQWQPRQQHYLVGKALAALPPLLPAVGEAPEPVLKGLLLVAWRRAHQQQGETGRQGLLRPSRPRQRLGQKQPGRDARGGCEEGWCQRDWAVVTRTRRGVRNGGVWPSRGG
ncbi:hypothetical protein CLOM_g14603 [Closterium sp. NIES-68]|nr:hypothetical protein CLOM_g14603 [Closterium sp. NIES-68]GJP82446.1 hypothetical protein CLOP_g12705 [Closterium sp. NIES-67]